jgi:hypothetical protein
MRRTDAATVTRIRELRELGLPLKDVAAWTGVAPSTVLVHTRDIPPPPREQWRPAVRLTKGSLHAAKLAEIAEADAWAAERVAQLTDDAYFAAGIALYAGEGSKTDGSVKLVNTNPEIVVFFLCWLREHFVVDESRLRGHLYLHEDLDLDAALRHWSGLTRIPLEQFGKPYRAVADPSIRGNRHEMGCLAVAYHCSRTHRQVMGLCRALLSCRGSDPA